MTTSKYKPVARDVGFTDNMLIVKLIDRKEIHVPLTSYPNLANANEEERRNYSIIANGNTLCWKKIDEFLSVEYLFEDYGLFNPNIEHITRPNYLKEIDDEVPSFLK